MTQPTAEEDNRLGQSRKEYKERADATNLNVELPSDSHRRVLEGLDDTHVRVLHRGVLSNEDNADSFEKSVVSGASETDRGQLTSTARARKTRRDSPRGQVLPPRHQAVSPLPSLVSDIDRREVEPGLEVSDESLVFEEERDVVGRLDVVDSHDLGGLDVAEH